MARVWKCYNNNCRTPLGMIVGGELVVSATDRNVQHINTEGAFLNITCSACGRVNKWVPKDSDLVDALMNTHFVQELIKQFSRLWTRGNGASEEVPECDEVLEEVDA